MIKYDQRAKSGMSTHGVMTRSGLKKLSSGLRGFSQEEDQNENQPLNETVKNSAGVPSARSAKQSHKGEQGAADVAKVDSVRGSKKRKIEEISNEDAHATSPSHSRRKMLRSSPTKEELIGKEEFVSLFSFPFKP